MIKRENVLIGNNWYFNFIANKKNSFFTNSLISLQRKVYEDFLKKELKDILKSFFPVSALDGQRVLTLLDLKFKSMKETDKLNCKLFGETFSTEIFTKWKLNSFQDDILLKREKNKSLRKTLSEWLFLTFGVYFDLKKENNEIFVFEKKSKKYPLWIEIKIKSKTDNEFFIDCKYSEIYELFWISLPLMTKENTFIINGHEKAIVSQMLRCAGVYFKKNIIQQGISSKDKFTLLVIPGLGSWFELKVSDRKVIVSSKKKQEKEELIEDKQVTSNKVVSLLFFKLKKTKKIPVSFFLSALGLSKEDVFKVFGKHELLQETYKFADEIDFIEALKIVNSLTRYEKNFSFLINNSKPNTQFMNFFFNENNFSWRDIGRYKTNQQLSILQRANKTFLAVDILDKKNNVFLEKGIFLQGDKLEKLKLALEKGYCQVKFSSKLFPKKELIVNVIKIFNRTKSKICSLVEEIDKKNPSFSIGTFLTLISYVINYNDKIVIEESTDDLSNKRVKTIGEFLRNIFSRGIRDVSSRVNEIFNQRDTYLLLRINKMLEQKPLKMFRYNLNRFFNLSPLIQFMDQTNPISSLSNIRRITVLGPSGLHRSRAGIEVRDVHSSYLNKICPIETPEGPNIGLISNLANYAKINDFGFIETPYWKVQNGLISKEIEYLASTDEKKYIIVYYTTDIIFSEVGEILNKELIAFKFGEIKKVKLEEVTHLAFANDQMLSAASSCVTFIQHNDANRALMGCNMSKQAVPLLKPEVAIVNTGIEGLIAQNSGFVQIAEHDGTVEYVDANKIIVKATDNNDLLKKEITKFSKKKNSQKKNSSNFVTYDLIRFFRTNQNVCLNQHPIVRKGQKIKKGEIISDGPAIKDKQLALGNNVLVAFMSWYGYTYEDSIVVSERLVRDNTFTSIHIKTLSVERRSLLKFVEGKEKEEIFTHDLPNVPLSERANLDNDGIILTGTRVKEGDILVGKLTPMYDRSFQSNEVKLIADALNKEAEIDFKNTSLTVPQGVAGVVCRIDRQQKWNDNWDFNVIEVVKIYIAEKRKLSEGDKMSGRHGNKGVISKIVPLEHMPFLDDGTPVDIVLNPLGVPSRMNIGQILECIWSLVGYKLKKNFTIPVFSDFGVKELDKYLKEAKIDNYGQVRLRDGITGKVLGKKINVGYLYFLKLSHMVDDKMHARNVGPYTLITQQPTSGKAQDGGQKFGEMEVGSLEAYGAAFTLWEMLTIKSDSIYGKNQAYEAIVNGSDISYFFGSEAFNVLVCFLQGLAIRAELLDDTNKKRRIFKN